MNSYNNKGRFVNFKFDPMSYHASTTNYRYNDSNYMKPDTYYIPPTVIQDYAGETINTYIPGYGRQNVYIQGMDRNGMVSLVLLKTKPNDCVKVHYSDLSGISPAKFKCRPR